MLKKEEFIMKRIKILLLLLISGVFFCFNAHAATIYCWTSLEDGNWNTGSNWTDGHVPNGAGAGDQARIDNNSDNDVTVSLDMNAYVSGLRVDAGDALGINNNRYLRLSKDGAINPTITNNGVISLNDNGYSGYTQLYAYNNAVATLTGSGKVILGNTLQNRLIGSGGFINDTNHTIEGGGQIYAPVENKGNIIANNGTMRISRAITNTSGTMSVSGSDNILDIRSTVTGGNINLLNDGSVQLYGATIVLKAKEPMPILPTG